MTDGLPVLARDVFAQSYGAPTRAQELAWPAIAAGRSALVVAPTGSGKTLAAFYSFLARMIEAPREIEGIELVYVSPLKALATDIERNLRAPLVALTEEALRRGLTPAPVPVAVRTGDTAASHRAAMLRRPPRVLVTTPESLYLVLTSPRGRHALRAAKAVIVDEVHALVPGKRGVHLTLSLERLERLCGRPLQRVGLSATVAPLAETALWLGGRDAAGEPRPVDILDAGERKRLDLELVAPADPAVVGPRGIWPPIAAELVRIIEAHRSVLVFCQSRRVAERVTGMINESAGKPLALSHHGSVSRERRQEIESQLKAGQLKAVVATGSLELGIDVGFVDCVVQVSSPKAVSRALQRIGRAGHVVGGVPRGRIVGTQRGDFLECAAVTRSVLARDIEETRAPADCLDVLAQQIVAEVAGAGADVPARELYATYRRAYPYRALAWDDFAAVVEMLAGRFQSNALREMKPRIDWDRRRGLLSPLPGSRLLAVSRPGTIPDRGLFRVEREETRERLGELDEEFVFETRVGDVFVLGATAWRVARITRDRVVVRPAAPGEPARMPFWRGEGLGRTVALGRAVGSLTREIAGLLDGPGVAAAEELVRASCVAAPPAARCVVEHVARQRSSGAALPDDRTVAVELYRDELGDARVALLSPYGGRVHAAWAILIAAEARARLGLEVPHVPVDDGILFRAPAGEAAERLLGMARWIPSVEAAARLAAEIDSTPLYAGLFRDAAQRALILPGRGPSGRAPLWLARLRAADLAQLMRGHPDFPVAREARREALEDALDVRGLIELLGAIERGQIQVVATQRSLPSPFAAQLELAFTAAFLYEADAPRVERRARALAAGPTAAAMMLSPEELEDLIDPGAVARLEETRGHRAPGTRARTPEELAEVLRRLADLGDAEIAERYEGDPAAAIASLSRAGRIERRSRGGASRWVLTEDADLWRDLDDPVDAGRAARAELAQRWAAARGPFLAGDLASRYALPEADVEIALEALARDGVLVRGRFVKGAAAPAWSDRRNLAEAHRRTLSVLRDRAAPIGVAQLARFLLDRHRAGDVGAAVRLLSGVQVPQETFERDLLWRRVQPYHPPLLDAACAAGEVAWTFDGTKLTVVPREELATWHEPPPAEGLDTDETAVLATLGSHGAQFGPELVERTGLRPAKVYTAVWSLVRRGLATNDAYESLRRALASDFDPAAAGLELDARASVRTLMNRARRTPWVGRFSRLVPDTAPVEERAARQAAILLRRYGVVGKAVADAEPRALPWALLEEALARLELRGEVVRGLFVEGLGAYQVAMPDAVDDLRAERSREALALINACDPACPYGSLAPDSEGRVARLPSNYLVLRGGAPLLLIEQFGKRITPLAEAPDEILAAALATLRGLLAVPAHLRGVRAVTVHRFGDRDAAAAHDLFARAGFSRDADRMVLSAF